MPSLYLKLYVEEIIIENRKINFCFEESVIIALLNEIKTCYTLYRGASRSAFPKYK